MFYFKFRKLARDFSRKQEHFKFVDNGTYAPEGRRWGVKVLQD